MFKAFIVGKIGKTEGGGCICKWTDCSRLEPLGMPKFPFFPFLYNDNDFANPGIILCHSAPAFVQHQHVVCTKLVLRPFSHFGWFIWGFLIGIHNGSLKGAPTYGKQALKVSIHRNPYKGRYHMPNGMGAEPFLQHCIHGLPVKVEWHRILVCWPWRANKGSSLSSMIIPPLVPFQYYRRNWSFFKAGIVKKICSLSLPPPIPARKTAFARSIAIQDGTPKSPPPKWNQNDPKDRLISILFISFYSLLNDKEKARRIGPFP